MEQCRTNLEQFRTTIRTGRTTWNNRQKFYFCERRVRQAKKAFFSSYNDGIQLIIWNNVQNNQNNLEQSAKVRLSKSGGWPKKWLFLSHCSGFYFKNSILQNNVEKTQKNSEQLSEQVEQPGTTGKSSIVVKEGFARPKKHFFRLTIMGFN